MSENFSERLIWIDLEMTGLNPERDSILEIATVVTDAQLEEVSQGPVFAIRHTTATLQAMDEWNREHHHASGLWQRVLRSTVSLEQAEQGTLEFLRQYSAEKTSPMCGNSICQDRRFLFRLMPRLEAWFHYRNLDVSTVKELAMRWAPSLLAGLTKHNRHEALADIRESIAELRYYRQFMGRLGGTGEM
ncbi:MAG TPA: oligoribonuclease [Xanthomonadales bacterium]|nr:oligoribonuclease [Xanthomonadales bacterium]